ncbi:hypothetical protein Q3G72_008317 [Acer saccharum]|nr:hypothetical protein Q3G72_008317 [Acer saccharum]
MVRSITFSSQSIFLWRGEERRGIKENLTLFASLLGLAVMLSPRAETRAFIDGETADEDDDDDDVVFNRAPNPTNTSTKTRTSPWKLEQSFFHRDLD